MIVPKAEAVTLPEVPPAAPLADSDQISDKALRNQQSGAGLATIEQDCCCSMRRGYSTAKFRHDSCYSHHSMYQHSRVSETEGSEMTGCHEGGLKVAELGEARDMCEVANCENRCTVCGHERNGWHDIPHGGD